jgi:DNA-binding CsgD family transcriptional regulator
MTNRKERRTVPAHDHINIDLAAEHPNGVPLTERELEVCRLIASGCSTRQAAAELFISPKTVEFHLGRAYRKLAVTNRAQLTQAMIAVVSQPPAIELRFFTRQPRRA